MLLALDTATTTASLALYDPVEARLLSEWTWQAQRRQTQDLLRAAQLMLEQSNCEPADLSALAVTTGPGSFTGVRIAISVAKGMGLGLPTLPRTVGVPTLRVTVAPWLAPAATCPGLPEICAFIQAGRGRYNWVTFTAQGEPAMPQPSDHRAGTIDAFAEELAQATGPRWLVGETTPEVHQAAADLPHVTLLNDVSALRRAGHLAHIAAGLIAADEDQPLHDLRPLYLRQPG